MKIYPKGDKQDQKPTEIIYLFKRLWIYWLITWQQPSLFLHHPIVLEKGYFVNEGEGNKPELLHFLGVKWGKLETKRD